MFILLILSVIDFHINMAETQLSIEMNLELSKGKIQ